MKDDELLLEVLEVSRMHLEDAGGDPEKAKADLRQRPQKLWHCESEDRSFI